MFKTFCDQNNFAYALCDNLYFCRNAHCRFITFSHVSFKTQHTSPTVRYRYNAKRVSLPFGLKKFASSYRAVIFCTFFRIVTDIRYNSIADDFISFSIDSGRVRGFRVDELWPFSSRQTGSVERIQREIHRESNFL